MKALVSIIIITVALIISSAMYLLRPKTEVTQPKKPVPALDITIAQISDIELEIESQGTVTPTTESLLTAEVSGKIIEVSPRFQDGGYFQDGDILAQIDPVDYIAALAIAESELASAEVNIQREEALAKQARTDWEKLGNGKASPLTLRIPQVNEAQAKYKAAEARVNQAKKNLDRTSIQAPYAGVIKRKRVEIGQMVNSMNTPIAEIYSSKLAEVRLPLTETQIGLIDLPNPYQNESGNTIKLPTVEITADLGDSIETWQATIERTEAQISTSTRTLQAIAIIENPFSNDPPIKKAPLRMGQFVQAKIKGKTLKNVFKLPRSSLLPDGNILVIDRKNKLYTRTVHIVHKDAESVIIDDDLEDGEMVAVIPLTYVVEGMHVKPVLPKNLNND